MLIKKQNFIISINSGDVWLCVNPIGTPCTFDIIHALLSFYIRERIYVTLYFGVNERITTFAFNKIF